MNLCPPKPSIVSHPCRGSISASRQFLSSTKLIPRYTRIVTQESGKHGRRCKGQRPSTVVDDEFLGLFVLNCQGKASGAGLGDIANLVRERRDSCWARGTHARIPAFSGTASGQPHAPEVTPLSLGVDTASARICVVPGRRDPFLPDPSRCRSLRCEKPLSRKALTHRVRSAPVECTIRDGACANRYPRMAGHAVSQPISCTRRHNSSRHRQCAGLRLRWLQAEILA